MSSVSARVAAIDWERVATELDARGYATVGQVLDSAQTAQLAALYPERSRFRSLVDMARLGFGVGEYKYFARPLPAIVQELRVAIYRRLAPIANRWTERLGARAPYPASLAAFLRVCHAHGQTKPTPLLLRYTAGGYNCLHQDLYGEIAFPLQFACVLSAPGNYTGGEFMLVEQRPRAQSRGEAIALGQGEGIIFPNRYRPVAGTRGDYRVNVRHGVSTVRSGVRNTLGIIFHDAR